MRGGGYHLILRGNLPPGGRRKGPIEMYDQGRFVTCSGKRLVGYTTVEDRQQELNGLHAEVFPPTPPRQRPAVEVDRDDGLVISLCTRHPKFMELFFHGDLSDYDNDHSRADLALCGILACYTRDAQQIARVFRESALYRDKWERDDYRARTITRALEGGAQ